MLNDASIPDAAKAALKKKVEGYRKTIARYESEPETGEGKKELLAKAKEYEKQARPRAQAGSVFRLCRGAAADRDRADFRRHHRRDRLAGRASAAVLGVVGALLMVNGYLLLVEIPFLG